MRIPAKVGGVGVFAIVDIRAHMNILTTSAAKRMERELPTKTETLNAGFGQSTRSGLLGKILVKCSPDWQSEEAFRVADRDAPEILSGIP